MTKTKILLIVSNECVREMPKSFFEVNETDGITIIFCATPQEADRQLTNNEFEAFIYVDLDYLSKENELAIANTIELANILGIKRIIKIKVGNISHISPDSLRAETINFEMDKLTSGLLDTVKSIFLPTNPGISYIDSQLTNPNMNDSIHNVGFQIGSK